MTYYWSYYDGQRWVENCDGARGGAAASVWLIVVVGLRWRPFCAFVSDCLNYSLNKTERFRSDMVHIYLHVTTKAFGLITYNNEDIDDKSFWRWHLKWRKGVKKGQSKMAS